MPFVLVSLRGAWGWTLCGVVWGLAALGLAIKLTPLARIRGLSTGSYLAMGWTVLVAGNAFHVFAVLYYVIPSAP